MAGCGGGFNFEVQHSHVIFWPITVTGPVVRPYASFCLVGLAHGWTDGLLLLGSLPSGEGPL